MGHHFAKCAPGTVGEQRVHVHNNKADTSTDAFEQVPGQIIFDKNQNFNAP